MNLLRPTKKPVLFEDFAKIDIRVGRIVKVEDFPEARKPLYKLTVNFGSLGTKQTGAGLRPYYTKEQLLGKQVVAVVNFPPRQIANFRSEFLVLGAVTDNDEVVLLHPTKEVELGSHVA